MFELAAQCSLSLESLLVSRDWGVQVTTNYYLWGPRRTFVHKDDLSAIIINEGFYSWKVIYYLAIMVKGQEKLVLPFEVRDGFLYVKTIV